MPAVLDLWHPFLSTAPGVAIACIATSAKKPTNIRAIAYRFPTFDNRQFKYATAIFSAAANHQYKPPRSTPSTNASTASAPKKTALPIFAPLEARRYCVTDSPTLDATFRAIAPVAGDSLQLHEAVTLP